MEKPHLQKKSVKSVRKRDENDFIFGKEIGEGSFSSVYLVKDIHTQKEYAAKRCLKAQIKKEKKVESIMREKAVMEKLSCNESPTAPFFVSLFCTFQNVTDLFFVLSYCKHGEFLKLIQQVGNFDYSSAQFYTGELVRALEHMHSLGIVHRDLKPENILLDETMHIKISDFGSAKFLENIENESPGTLRSSSFVGTAQYASPEVIHKQQCCLASDFWALGCIIYQIVSGLPPFRSKSEYLIFQMIKCANYEFPVGFFDDAKDMVQRLLVLDATRRLGANDTVGQYISMREHKFLSSIDIDTLYMARPPTITTFTPDEEDQNIWDGIVQPGLATTRELELLLNSNCTVSSASKTVVNQSVEQSSLSPPVVGELSSTTAQKTASIMQQTPQRRTSKVRRNIADVTAEEHDKRLLEQEQNSKWHKFVEGNLILKQGLLNKKKGLFPRTRMFLLTTGPHLYYVDPVNSVLKGQVPLDATTRPEARNFRVFFIHTPHRTYNLTDHNSTALEWIDAVEQVRDFYFPDCGR